MIKIYLRYSSLVSSYKYTQTIWCIFWNSKLHFLFENFLVLQGLNRGPSNPNADDMPMCPRASLKDLVLTSLATFLRWAFPCLSSSSRIWQGWPPLNFRRTISIFFLGYSFKLDRVWIFWISAFRLAWMETRREKSLWGAQDNFKSQ